MLKRMVVSIVGLSVLLALYMVYVRVFGHFSNLEELPPDLLPNGTRIETPWTTNESTIHRTKQIAREVFGPDSWQANADIALNWERSGVIIYILDYEPVDAQSLRLVPFSLVYIEASKKDGSKPQIVTLEGKDAVLEFDRPVDPIRMTTAKPLGVKIKGNVQIQADRGTPDPLDDLVVYADYLEFNDEQKRIWTEAPVRIVSADTVMTGTGGEIHLNLNDSKKSRDLPMFQGVRDFNLFRDVQINMLAGAGSGLVPGATHSRGESENKAEKPKMPVTITCQGPFVYEFADAQGRFSNAVMMIRQTGEAQFDRLLCDELVIDFAKTKSESDPSTESKSDESELQFRRAYATGRAVRILSDAQAVEAIGNEMEHDVTTGLTILRGDPEVVATQAANVLHGRELKFSPAEQGERNAEAVGAGSIESRDPATGEIKLLAHWNDGARIEPHADGQQLLTLVGAAEVDQPGRGTLAADRVKVWLTRGSGDAESSAQDAAAGSSKWTPSRLEGIGNVVTKSDQFILEAAHRLDMVIEDAPPPTNSQAPLAAAASRTKTQDGAKSGTSPRGGKESASGTRKQPASESQEAKTEKPPAHLVAERIRIRALRDGERTEIAEVWTEGRVNLNQPPDENGANAVVVRGDNLYLKRIEQKNHLEVTGRPAHVEMNDLKVDGAHVCLDQPTGVAWVEGKGMMVLPSDTSFDGKKLNSPSELTIAWGSNMVFTGDSAEFGGGVEAHQGTSRLRCQRLEAFLTERLDISAPRKREQGAAKIDKLICTDAVVLDNLEFQGDRLEKYDHLESRQLEFVNSTGQMTAQGPGIARSYSRGSANIMAPQPGATAARPVAAQKPPKANDDQLLMTEVHFTDRMEADRTNQIGKFFGHIEVIRAPVVNENELIDPDKLPPNSMRLSCETLEMATKKGPGDKLYNIMLGQGNVDIEANNVFSGRGDRVSYNQLYERIIFESRPGSFATLYRQTRQGERWDTTRAFKIYYNLRTGEVKVEGGIEVDLTEREADRKNMTKVPPKKM